MTFLVVEVLAAALLYAAAAFAVWQHHAHGETHTRVIFLAAAGLVLQAISLAHTALHAGVLVIGVGTALSLFAWQAALLLWLLTLRRPMSSLELTIYPLAGFFALIGLLIPDPNGPHETASWTVQAHIILSMLAYGLFTLSAVQACIVAMQQRQLRRRPPHPLLSTLPPLQSMETFLFRLIGGGFYVLTLAIVTGLFFISDILAQHLTHKLVLSIIAWLIFGSLLLGRLRYGWRGRVAIRGAIIGYAVLVLAYFGSKLVLELILGEHW